MNELQKVFNYGENQVRTVLKDGEVWFVAKDVCEVLNIQNISQAVGRLEDDEKLVYVMYISGQNRNVLCVNESGLYELIWNSRKEEAQEFKKWVKRDVLPSIRQTGSYSIQIPRTLPEALRAYANEVEAHESTRLALETAQPKAEYFDALVERNLLTNFRDTAKELHIGQKKFINWLLENGYVYRDQKRKLKPYMKYVPEVFELKEWERNGKADVQTLVTPKGKETFRLLLG